MKRNNQLPVSHTDALDVICGGKPELENMRDDLIDDAAKRYPGLSDDQHLALVRACMEHWYTSGMEAEAYRVGALLKLLKPETRELVFAAIMERGKLVDDILDQALELLKQGRPLGAQNAGVSAQSSLGSSATKRVQALAKAVTQRAGAKVKLTNGQAPHV